MMHVDSNAELRLLRRLFTRAEEPTMANVWPALQARESRHGSESDTTDESD